MKCKLILNSTLSQSTYSLIKVFTETRRHLQSLFLFKKVLLISPSAQLDPFLFPPILKSCSSLVTLNYGIGIHGFLIKYGFGKWDGTGKSLMLMYVKSGLIIDAYKVFDEMPIRDKDMFNSLICSLGFNEFHEDVLIVFEEMIKSGFSPYFTSLRYAILACSELGCIEKGFFLYDLAIVNGFNLHILISNPLISMFVKMGRLDYSRMIFDNMACKDLVSWNSLITGYARIGNSTEVFKLFLSMKMYGTIVPNQITFLALLCASGKAENVDLGKSIHGHLICTGLLSNFRMGTAILNMYAKCDMIHCARRIFEEDLLQKSLVSWNSLISGYSQIGYLNDAITIFKRMNSESNSKPDSITFANVIPSFVSLGNIGNIQTLHSLILKKGLDIEQDVVLGTAMVDAYGKLLNTKAAKTLFVGITKPNSATWNALIEGCNLNNHNEKGVLYFREMLQRGAIPDEVTMVILFQICENVESLEQGNIIHGFCISAGFSSSIIVENVMIDMYMRFGSLNSSELIFNSMNFKNIVTWNTLLYGYLNDGLFSSVINFFRKMQLGSLYKPDNVTMIPVIQAASSVMASQGVEIIYALISKLGLNYNTQVMNSLIDSYAKNGLIEKAKILFTEEMGYLRDRCSWNVIISGYGMNGKGTEACELFSSMEGNGYEPDYITFTCLLSTCSHCGLIEQGLKYFDMMVRKYKISPNLQHLTCIVDMLSRAGRLEDAYKLIQTCDEVSLSNCNSVWGALLSSCRLNMDMEIGEFAGKKLSELAPENSGFHTLMSNLYASSKRWDAAVNARRTFDDDERLIKKTPGLSFIQT